MRALVRSLNRGEWLLLGLLAVWSLIPLAAGILHLIEHGDVLGGSDGIGVVDHFQYLAWIREAGEGGLISNRYDLESSDGVYLQPMWLLAGLGWAAGLPIQAGLLIWKPACVVVLFAGSLAYVRRTLEGRGARFAALALALFYLPPAAALMGRTGVGDPVEDGLVYLFGFQVSPATYLWGYVQTAVAVGLMPAFLLAVERRRVGVAAVAGLLVSWVHPWQGMVLIGILVGVAAWSRLVRPLIVPALATALPIVYFVVLAQVDPAWGEGSEDVGYPHEWGWLLVSIVPLAAFAVAGALRGRPPRELDLQERMLLLWPVVTLVIYAALDRTFIYNVLSGLTIPLAVLAVRGGRGLPRWAAAAAVVVATLPGLANLVYEFREGEGAGGSPRYLEPGEADALEFLDDTPREGGVLTRFYLGQAVPGLSGRRTYVGHPVWTPDFERRVERTEELFLDAYPPAEARAFVRGTGAAFVLEDCQATDDLAAELRPLIRRTHRFGCATVYELGA
jgi:hypothetical protein